MESSPHRGLAPEGNYYVPAPTHPVNLRAKLFWVGVAMAWAAGCSLADLDALTRGSGISTGGTFTSAGTAGLGGNPATTPSSGGRSAGGSENLASLAGGGTSTVASSGAGHAGLAGVSGFSAAGSNQNGGGTTSTSVPASCPAYVGAGGTLVTPPSNGFEKSIEDWTKLSGPSGVTRVAGDGTACDGTGYLNCNGTTRQGGWDGPSVTLTPYLTVGHSYVMTVTARFSKDTVPTSARSIGLTLITVCDSGNPVYTPSRKAITTSTWMRLQSDVPLQVPPLGCKTLSHAAVYVETDDADAALSIDVDDFRLIDKTDPSAAAGAAGASSIAGAAGVTVFTAGGAGTASGGDGGTAGRGL